MRNHPFARGLLILALAVLSRSAEAQLGGITQKLKQAVKKDPAEAQQGQTGPRFAGDLIEITAPVVEGVIRGLRTEIDLRREFRATLAKYPTPEQYEMCQSQVAMSEEGQKVLELMILPDNATDQQRQRAMEKYQTEILALRKRKCPLDPADWDTPKKAAKLAEIDLKAAEATGLSTAAGGEDQEGAMRSSGPLERIESLELGPISVVAYQLFKERIVAFCAAKLAPDTDFSVTPVQIPGQGTKVYWVYTSNEAKVLQAQCGTLMGLLSQLAIL